MSKYFFDTEFSERPCTIDLISIGIVSEDGRELYCVSSEFNEAECNEWVKENVIPLLPPEQERMTRKDIANAILEFIGDDTPEFWGHFADYDWVVFCWLFGSMIDLPEGWPMYCRDLKQLMDSDPFIRIHLENKNEHNALADAKWCKKVYEIFNLMK